MLSVPKIHVLTLLNEARRPITQEQVIILAKLVRYPDTPQSLRTRMVELEKAGYVRRVDRFGVSTHDRPCWRWQLTETGRKTVRELFDVTTTSEGR